MIGIYEYLLVMFLVSVLAGLIGALVGVGGGILVVPALTLLFGVPIEFAVGASIVSVIATSSGSASAYVRDRITNLRIGMFLEIGSTAGAVVGAVTSIELVRSGLSWLVFVVFGLMLFFSAYSSARRLRRERVKGGEVINQRPNELSTSLKLSGEYYDKATKTRVDYVADRVAPGFGVMVFAGMISALLGVGGGILKVVGMDSFMKLPFKVSTTTSNFMIGVTAAASTAIYYIGGYVNPVLAAPVAIGIVIGAFAGTKVLVRSKPGSLRWLFVIVLLVIGIEMIHEGLF
ncbi:MAG: sulfite exporter TauE/SafE family protein [Nitrososphaerales archaeon]